MSNSPEFIEFTSFGEASEGFIVSTQVETAIPFRVKRVFWTLDTPADVVRGRHAHRNTEQVLVAITGSVKVVADAGKGEEQTFVLDSPGKGLYLPAMHWANIYFTEGAVLLSLASSDFDEADYIREYNQFLEEIKRK